MSESTINVVNASRFRVMSSVRPLVGVSVEITVATPAGEQTLQTFWMPPEMAESLSRALVSQVERCRSAN